MATVGFDLFLCALIHVRALGNKHVFLRKLVFGHDAEYCQ